jgi:hypothetical protein
VSIDPSSAYTVLRRPLLPPKPAPRILSPKLSMVDEAAQVRARFRAKWPALSGGASANAERSEEGRQRQAELVSRVTDLLSQHGPMTAQQLMAATDVSKSRMGAAIQRMQDNGKIAKGARTNNGYLWGMV